MSAADPEERWFNAVKIRLLAWIAVAITIPALGLAGTLFLASINAQLTNISNNTTAQLIDIKKSQADAVVKQETTAGQVNAVQQNIAVISTTITEGLVKSVQGANEVNVAQNREIGELRGEIGDLRDRLGKAEGDLKVLQELQKLRLPNPESK